MVGLAERVLARQGQGPGFGLQYREKKTEKKTEFFRYLPFKVAAESRQEKKNPESLAGKSGSLPVVKVEKKPLSF